jgi:hypothetical protein
MTYEDLKKTIQDSSKDDWLYNDSKGIFTAKWINILSKHRHFRNTFSPER